SSRRRHTRSKRDWSSDVCSSDLLKTVLHDLHIYRIQQYAHQVDRRLNGIVSVSSEVSDWVNKGTLIRGIQLAVNLDSTYFEDEGEMYELGKLITNVFIYCVSNNNMLKVNVNVMQTKKIWSFKPMMGLREQL